MSNNMTDSEYLAGELMTDAEFMVFNDFVKITTPSTIHVSEKRIKPLCKSAFKALYKEVLKIAKKEPRAKILYKRHISKETVGKWNEYENSLKEANELFDMIVKQAKVVQYRGLHYGTVYDEELKKLKDLCHCYSKLSYCGTIISAVTGDYFYLETTYKDLKHLEPNVETIYVYL